MRNILWIFVPKLRSNREIPPHSDRSSIIQPSVSVEFVLVCNGLWSESGWNSWRPKRAVQRARSTGKRCSLQTPGSRPGPTKCPGIREKIQQLPRTRSRFSSFIQNFCRTNTGVNLRRSTFDHWRMQSNKASMDLPFKMHHFPARKPNLTVTQHVLNWITCPANQRSSSPTPCFSDRLRWGMTRGSKHRYHRKYCERITSNFVKVYAKQRLRSMSSFFAIGGWKMAPGTVWSLPRLCSGDGGLFTCEVQTLLKETKTAVWRKQEKARSEWKAQDAANSRMSCGRNAARPSHWLHLLSAPT